MYKSENDFTVNATVKGELMDVTISRSETSDGVDFFICRLGYNELTQIRKDAQEWKQIWGDLEGEDVKSIGNAIEGALLNQQ